MKLLLDTHVAYNVFVDPKNLSAKILDRIEDAQFEGLLFMSSISLWEIAMLIDKNRIKIKLPIRDFLGSMVNIDGLSIIDITANIAAESVSFGNSFHGDPADRIIVATAQVLGATLITRDERILNWSKQGHIKCIEA